MIYLLEGPDCSGKTTLGKKLAQVLGATYFHSINLPDEFLTKYHKELFEDVLFNHGHSDIVIDRHFVSRMAYQENSASKALTDQMLDKAGIKPVIIFCLTDSCIRRHREEQDPDHPYSDEYLATIYKAYRSIYLAFSNSARYHTELYDLDMHGKNMMAFIKLLIAKYE